VNPLEKSSGLSTVITSRGEFRIYDRGKADDRLFRMNVDNSEKIVPHVWSFKQWAIQSVELKYAIETMSRQNSETTAVQA
jgi:hypothetical protein